MVSDREELIMIHVYGSEQLYIALKKTLECG